ncbi:serine/threonine-protein kinase [Aquabacterium sp.]|uniref:serine/threonine-protein kinase n=1 Tax=Aquabacterium sp. TaxID=1872578 RepID=UPI003D6C9DE7
MTPNITMVAPLLILLLLVVAAGLVVWLVRQNRRTPPAARSTFGPSTQQGGRHSRSGANTRPRRRSSLSEADREKAVARVRMMADAGPETVLSYLHSAEDSLPPSAFDSALPLESGTDFSQTTRPQTWQRSPAEALAKPAASVAKGQKASTAQAEGMERVAHALNALKEGPADQAWNSLKGFRPEPGQREACLETLEGIAQAFERDQRYHSARDVYEHMADIDPEWRQVKLRLMRARGLAQAAASNTWGTVPSRPMPEENQRQLGKYLVEKEIGRGAMGAVYLGYDPVTDHKVALKTMALAREFQGDELADARARFLREAEMAGRLDHPDIVSIIGAGETDGLAFIAMELVEGVDISQYAHPAKLLPLAQLLPIMARVADALAYAHTRGVTHRDIKPANIMVDLASGSVKVMDFGVARVADAARTRTGVVLGTPTFMSPEQLSGQTLDGRTDLYSLGVSLFQLLTGYLPYRNDSMAQLMRAIAQEEVPNVCDLRDDLPRPLGDIVALALQKHPNTRYANGLQMAEDLRAVAQAVWAASNVDIELG